MLQNSNRNNAICKKILTLIRNYYYIDFNTIKRFLHYDVGCIKFVLNDLIKDKIIKVSVIDNHKYYYQGNKDALIDGNSAYDITLCLTVLSELKKYYKIRQHTMFPFPQTVKYVIGSKTDNTEEAYGEIMRLSDSNLDRAIYMYHPTHLNVNVERIIVLDEKSRSLLNQKQYINDSIGPVKMYVLIDKDYNVSYQGGLDE